MTWAWSPSSPTACWSCTAGGGARGARRADRRAGPHARDLPRPAAPLHVGAARLDRATRPPAAAPPDRDRRQPRAGVGDTLRLRVRGLLPVSLRALLGAAAAGRQAGRGGPPR